MHLERIVISNNKFGVRFRGIFIGANLTGVGYLGNGNIGVMFFGTVGDVPSSNRVARTANGAGNAISFTFGDSVKVGSDTGTAIMLARK